MDVAEARQAAPPTIVPLLDSAECPCGLYSPSTVWGNAGERETDGRTGARTHGRMEGREGRRGERREEGSIGVGGGREGGQGRRGTGGWTEGGAVRREGERGGGIRERGRDRGAGEWFEEDKRMDGREGGVN